MLNILQELFFVWKYFVCSFLHQPPAGLPTQKPVFLGKVLIEGSDGSKSSKKKGFVCYFATRAVGWEWSGCEQYFMF